AAGSAALPASDSALTRPESGRDAAGGAADSAAESSAGGDAAMPPSSGVSADLEAAGREIAATASATVEVEDAAAATDAIGTAAAAAGGYVESMSVGESGTSPLESAGMEISRPLPTSAAWITVRVPADRLPDTLAGLADVGNVTSSQIDRRDVTTEAVDLRARVSALEASVARLTELLGQSTSTGDLIAAESALSQRQSELDGLRQQLTWLESQVAMSSVTVTLIEPAPAVKADPAGFGGGLAAGWNGLVATLNGVVIAIGFLLPWIAVLLVAGLVIWGARRAVRRRRVERDPAD
ncbi:DUF4349 domain-containing protein, partial [Microbacterium sp.]|uniref:DUF4349 domain-containing protein n=1 Tax=Microbacterium sp. TaxID=51671 RepID=UPI003C7469C1